MVGERVKDMQNKGFPIETAEGLDFCKQNVLDDTRVRHILEALFPWSGLGIYDVYQLDSNNIYAFLTGLYPKLTAVVVQLWSPESSMVIYGGSQDLRIKGLFASNGLLEIPYASVRQCKPINVEMEKGGLAIFDARLAFQTVKGFAIYFVFVSSRKGGPQKKFPGNSDLKIKANAMESKTIGLNFIFEESSA